MESEGSCKQTSGLTDRNRYKAGLREISWLKATKSDNYHVCRSKVNAADIGSMKRLCKELDSNIRYRLRMCIWKHWKTPQNRAKNLMKLGVNRRWAFGAAYSGARIAYICQRGVMNNAVTKERLTRFGLVSMLDYYTERCVTC